MIVAFQGEHGAYSEEAIRRHFGPDAQTLPCESFTGIFQAVQRGDATYGMLPVENALAGTVAQSYELLMEYDFRVQAEVLLAIRHHLLAPEGIALDDVRRVKSHPQALAQCADTLQRRGWEPVATYDTAGAAHDLAEKPEPHTAVIASAFAGELYGLTTLESGIEDDPMNSTRFFVIGPDDAPRHDPSKTSLVFGVRHRPRALYDCIGAFAERDINLTKIESRPIRGRPWQYWFYLDFEGHWQDPDSEAALVALLHRASMVKMLGSYPAASGGPNST
ncbi:prephenate dehydratase [Aggregatilinea lenta]|uniref:prephenate dehydratase n=1 Tax=Aggregatilinea lenta TaxID=913108 RepID=UPI000E5BD812|nr:prephenate dehydratase [Aggregatilinea lenta]